MAKQSARSGPGLVAGWLHASPDPVFLLGPDRTLLYLNPACEEWLGVAAAQVVGQYCRAQSRSDREGGAAAAHVLYPPPSAWIEPDRLAWLVWSRPGEPSARWRTRFTPLEVAKADDPGLLGVVDSASRSPLPEGAAADGSPAPLDEPNALYERLRSVQTLRPRTGALARCAGVGALAQRLAAQIDLASRIRLPTTVRGPVAGGLGEIARSIHYAMDRARAGSLVPLHCGQLAADRLEAALRELSAGGFSRGGRPPTVLLEDLHSFPSSLGGLLVQALESEAGAACRWIATCRREGPPPALAALAGLPLLESLVVEVPTLVQQRSDLPLLAQALLEELQSPSGKLVAGFTAEAMDALALHPWNGDWDELREVVRVGAERATLRLIQPADLPSVIRHAQSAAESPPAVLDPIALEEVLADVEREMLQLALARARGNKSKAAALVGMTRPRFHRRLVHLGLESAPEPEADSEVRFEEVDGA